MAITQLNKNSIKKRNATKSASTGTSSSSKARASSKSSTVHTTFRDELISQSSTVEGGAVYNIFLENGELNQDLISQLQDNIHSLGDVLLEKPGYNTVIAYRNSVQSLLKSILPYLHKKEDIEFPKKIGGVMHKRKFTLINQVNATLDTVLKLVLMSQDNQMQIMKSLDEIKGLIIDILH